MRLSARETPDRAIAHVWLVDTFRSCTTGRSALGRPGVGAHDSPMAWYFRVIALADGRWACRRGMEHYDSHIQLQEAVGHLRSLAGDSGPAELFVHRLDGTVEHPDAL